MDSAPQGTPLGLSGRILRPTLDVELSIDDPSLPAFRTKALVDTGSPLSIFPRGAADALALDVGRLDAATSVVEMVGQKLAVETRVVTLELPDLRGHYWATEIAFLCTEWEMNYGILGHRGFLDKWVVTFVAHENAFIVESPESYESQ